MRATRYSEKKKCRVRIPPLPNRDLISQRISPRSQRTIPSSSSILTCVDDLPVFSSDDILEISIVKKSLRKYDSVPEGKEDASRLSVGQINIIRSSLSRFNDIDFTFCKDKLLWTNVVLTRASIQESSLTREDTSL